VHSSGIIHRDIKPENILLADDSPDSRLVLIDFGNSVRIKPRRKIKRCTGTCFYMAPEVINGRYDHKCDIWSSGILLFVMIGGYPPFNGSNTKEIFKSILKGRFTFDEEEWDNISSECKNLISKMLNTDPNKRPDAE